MKILLLLSQIILQIQFLAAVDVDVYNIYIKNKNKKIKKVQQVKVKVLVESSALSVKSLWSTCACMQ